LKKQLQKPTYHNVPENGSGPAHTVIYKTEDAMELRRNATVKISTRDNMFFDSPVHPGQGIRTVVKYLAMVNDAVAAVKAK